MLVWNTVSSFSKNNISFCLKKIAIQYYNCVATEKKLRLKPDYYRTPLFLNITYKMTGAPMSGVIALRGSSPLLPGS